MTAHSDARLFLDWQQGDHLAGEHILRRNLPALRRFLNARVGREDTDELVQRTIVGLLEGIQRFQPSSSFAALLLGIARRQLAKYRRDQVRRAARVVRLAEVAMLTPRDTTIATKSDDALLGAPLLLAVTSLPTDQRIVVELYYWKGLPALEIARTLGIRATTVRTRLHRARRALELALRREHLAARGYEPSQLLAADTRARARGDGGPCIRKDDVR